MDSKPTGYGMGLFDETATRGSRGLLVLAATDVALVSVVLFADLSPVFLGSVLILPAIVAPALVWIDVDRMQEEANWTWRRIPLAAIMFLSHGLFILAGFMAIVLYLIRRWQTFNYESIDLQEQDEQMDITGKAVSLLSSEDNDPNPSSWEDKEQQKQEQAGDDGRPWE